MEGWGRDGEDRGEGDGEGGGREREEREEEEVCFVVLNKSIN